MADVSPSIEALLSEERRFPPSQEFIDQANVSDPDVYQRADADYEGFWESWAEELHWFEKWDKVLQWDPPFAQWFLGGKTNISYNCLDRHLEGPRRNKAAIVWEGEPGDWQVYTYGDLHREVCRFANGLKSLGVKKGDRVTLYMPMIPELAIAMLACARIGAPHSIVFGGFSPESLRDRINDCEATVVITADGGYRRGGIIPLEAEYGRGGGRHADGRARCCSPTGGRQVRRVDAGGPGHLVARPGGGPVAGMPRRTHGQ